MTYIVTSFVFHSIYVGLYLLPVLVGIEAAKRWAPFLEPVFVIIGIALFVVAIYRSRLAAHAYGERDIGLWEAHAVSGYTLRLNLSFLPVIGRWFRAGIEKGKR